MKKIVSKKSVFIGISNLSLKMGRVLCICKLKTGILHIAKAKRRDLWAFEGTVSADSAYKELPDRGCSMFF